ncbi:MAG: oxygen-independent coproporphyrinogen III oxidase [Puniceicoccaceae bacterium 5H]|nr:MAG: oxygen-independent coproporphyrinogen III oxidase [Puniceicoccaceae bacterium 5H]
MNLQAKAVHTPPLGLYLHVPFCARACDFCNFYQEAPRRAELDRYLAGIERELQLRPIERPVDTVFWGGGTPSLLAAKDLERLGNAVLGALPQAPEEWTIEMAPSTVKADKLAVLRELGVNRISMGVQSFDPVLLDRLGRSHLPKQVYHAIDLIRAAGFENLNLDLIFAVPGQTLEAWEADLREALRQEPQHLSTYCLTFEEDTALWVKLQKGQTTKLSIEDESDYYTRAWEVLGEAGLPQYEISNFARPGFACRHNLNTWAMHEWLAYGPSASGQFGGRRWTNAANIDQWLEGVESGQMAEQEIVLLTAESMLADALVFGLRMNAGVDLEELQGCFGVPLPSTVAGLFRDLVEEGLMVQEGPRVALTLEGRLLADRIATAILEAL